MASEPTLLAFDTSAAHCAAALLSDDRLLAERTVPMLRGQAEYLMPMLSDLLSEASFGWPDLAALAVGIGPGNFTGIRISVSAARGLSFALGIPAIGVSMFDVMASDAQGRIADQPELLVCLEAPRGKAYVQAFRDGFPDGAPQIVDPLDPPPDLLRSSGILVIGHRAAEIAAPFGANARTGHPAEIPVRIARIARRRIATAGETPRRPAPLYVRPADAAPPSDPPPVVLP